MQLPDWAGALGSVLIGAVIAGGIYWSWRQGRRAVEGWASLARERSWTLAEERLPGRSVTTLQGRLAAATLTARSEEHARTTTMSAQGRLGGTRLALDLAASLDLGLVIVAGGARSALGDRLGVGEAVLSEVLAHAWPGTRLERGEVHTGDPDFDRDFLVRARDVEGARALLDARTRRAIRGVLEASPMSAVSDRGAFVGLPEPHADLSRVLPALEALADRLGSAR